MGRISLLALCERSGWKCHLCQGPVPVGVSKPHPLAPTRDHILPASQGGRGNIQNIALAHYVCNTWRKSREVTEARKERAEWTGWKDLFPLIWENPYGIVYRT